MQKTIYQRLNAVLWTLIVTFVVLLAIYVSAGRMLVSNMTAYQRDILQEINARVPFIVEAERVSGEWYSFTPVIVLGGLKLSVPRGDVPPLVLSEGRIAVDVLDSLLSGSLQMTRVELEDLALRGELTEEGQFRLEGIDGGGGEIGEWLRGFLLNVELISLRQNTLSLGLPNGERRELDLSLRLERDGSHRRLEVALTSSRGAQINILGEGVGDPFTPELFAGEYYARVTTDDLGAVRQILANRLPGVWAEGSVDLELWLAFERGESDLQGRLYASDLVIFNEERGWQLPLQRIALEAELLQGRDRWTLFGNGLEIRQENVSVTVPRLQIDGWGQALRVRAADMAVGSLADLAVSLPPLPPRLVDVLQSLNPEGFLSSLQLSIGDLRSPGTDWEVEARFRDLQVASRRGSPGVSAATGYLQVFPGRGLVLLDSPNLVLEFPAVYSDPLSYSDFHGAIHIGWDSELVRLTSDLLHAQGEEGTAKALFGLDIPLQPNEVGLDMSLLVGLENSHPVHRVKYVPDTLNKTLSQWLADSIGDGTVEQGAFLWRGSLKKGVPSLRTVQLAFNVSETFVDYHPRWPAVEVVQGIILMDDSEVSVWADEAVLYDSVIRRLSVETWLGDDRALMLAVDGRMQGPAGDGLTVLNASPIDDVVKGAFRQWRLQGDLEVDLEFELNLSDRKSPPQVDVQTRWTQVELDIVPGRVPLEAVSGDFGYNSQRGFTASEMVGTLWGKPFQLEISHPGLKAGGVYDPRRTATEVVARTRADLSDVQQWINLPQLAFASGETPAEVRLRVEPAEPPLLQVFSQLQGVELDFPRPWVKQRQETRPLRLSVALGAGGGPLDVELGDDLALKLVLREGALGGAALGIGESAGPVEEGVLRVKGRAPLLDGQEWQQFLTTYFAAGWTSAAEVQPSDPNLPAPDDPDSELAIFVDELQVDTLDLWGQSLSDVVFSLRVDAGQLDVTAEADWLQGEYRQESGQPASLLVKRLDLLGMRQLEPAQEGATTTYLQVPPMRVSVERLHRGELELGKLSFELNSEGPVLTATELGGDIAGLELGPFRVGGSPGEESASKRTESAQLTWQQEAPASTALKLGIEFQDLGDTLARLGYERIVETAEGYFGLDLNWPGAPQAFALDSSRGGVTVAIDEGRFLEAPSGASGALKVVNILNLADIVQRLSLSHMFESGIPFDSVEGEIFLDQGEIEVAGMEVKGPSSFYFSGVADAGERDLDGELVATLPVADNLPWVAALAAGLPVAAGVYVVSKLLQKQVDQLSSAVYSISGSWNDPQVEFAHIFDSGDSRENGARAQPASAGDPNTPPPGEADASAPSLSQSEP